MFVVDEPRIKAGVRGEIGVKPKSLLEAEILIDMHIREKGELRAKNEELERKVERLQKCREADAELLQQAAKLERMVDLLQPKKEKEKTEKSKIRAEAGRAGAAARWSKGKETISQSA